MVNTSAISVKSLGHSARNNIIPGLDCRLLCLYVVLMMTVGFFTDMKKWLTVSTHCF